MDKPENHGMWMRRTSGFMESGVICIAPLTQMGNLVDSCRSREKGYGGCTAVFQASAGRCWPYPGTGDDGWARLLSTSSTRDTREQCTASDNKYLIISWSKTIEE